jgi:hypothetical protein
MAAQYQALTVAVGQFVQAQQTSSQAAHAVQQAVVGLPPPDVAFQQQGLQTMQQMQQEMQTHQQQMQQAMQAHQQQMQQEMQTHQQQMQQAMQAHQQAMRADFRAVSNSVARLHNSRVARNQALQWLYNEQGQLPVHAPVSWRSINQVVLPQINAMLQHYGLEERAADMVVVDRRFLLLEHLGAESPEAAADQ